MNAIRILAVFSLFFVSATASVEAQSGGGDGTVAKGILFDGNTVPTRATLSSWHESMGEAVVEARPIALNLRALQFPDAARIPRLFST